MVGSSTYIVWSSFNADEMPVPETELFSSSLLLVILSSSQGAKFQPDGYEDKTLWLVGN